MCLAIPTKITHIDYPMATGEIFNNKVKINLSLLEDVNVDDYVLIHTGYAIQKVDLKEAQETLELIREINDGSN